MQERLESIRQNIDAIRKSGKLPHWRMVYADSLLTRAGEYVAVDRLPEASKVADKLDRWIKTHSVHLDSQDRFSALKLKTHQYNSNHAKGGYSVE